MTDLEGYEPAEALRAGLAEQPHAEVGRPDIWTCSDVGFEEFPADLVAGRGSRARRPGRPVRYRRIAALGESVSVVGLGTMGWGIEPAYEQAGVLAQLALDAGVNLFDTTAAPIGRARPSVTLQVEDSLRRLRRPWLDVVFVHRFCARQDWDDVLRALADLVTSGKVRAFGTSAFLAFEIAATGSFAADLGPALLLACEQAPYSIFARHIEAELLPLCASRDIALVAWSPLNGGWLSGKYRDGPGAS